jgi:hypothetical protein
MGGCSNLQILMEKCREVLVSLRRRVGQNPGQTSTPVYTAVGLQIEDDLVKAFEPPAMTRIFPEIVSLVLAGPGDSLRSDSTG